MGDDDSLTHVSGHVIIAVTSLCSRCRAEIEGETRELLHAAISIRSEPLTNLLPRCRCRAALCVCDLSAPIVK